MNCEIVKPRSHRRQTVDENARTLHRLAAVATNELVATKTRA